MTTTANRLPRVCGLAAALVAMAVGTAEPPVEHVGSEAPLIELAPGTSTTLTFERDIGTAFIAEPATADVNVLDQRTVFVLGRAPGITSLKIHEIGGNPLASFVVRVNLQSGYASAVVDRVVGPAHDIEVTPVGDALFVSGTAQSPAQAERLLRGIRAVSGESPVVNALALRTPAQVNLDVLISEVSRTVTRELGIDWSVDINPFVHPLRTWATGTGVRLGTGATQLARVYQQVVQFVGAANPSSPEEAATASNEIDELGIAEPPVPRSADGGIVFAQHKEVNSGKYRATAFLEALAENGLVVVHARPTLTTVSGKPAEFFSGLEIPVPTLSDGIVGTVYRQTGVNLAFTPTVLANNQISLTVEPRIREIAAGGATIAGTVVPNINERSASTTVELGHGESIAIAGLYRRNSTASESGIPLLKDIPLWGSLFRTSRESDRAVELIIVVTPRIVAGLSGSPLASSPSPSATAQRADQLFY